MLLNYLCDCGLINFTLQSKPKEICDCYCSLCRKDFILYQQRKNQYIHYGQKKFISFAKYPCSINLDINSPFLKKISSSSKANRYYCIACNKFICMYYHRSVNIWLVSDILQFSVDDVPHYELFNKKVNKII